MSIKTVDGKLYGYNDETGEYFDLVTREPVKIGKSKRQKDQAGPNGLTEDLPENQQAES